MGRADSWPRDRHGHSNAIPPAAGNQPFIALVEVDAAAVIDTPIHAWVLTMFEPTVLPAAIMERS